MKLNAKSKNEEKAVQMIYGPEHRLYDLDDAAAYLGRAKSGVRHLIYSGELPVVQMGEKGKQYLDLRDLEDFIMRHKRRLP